MSIEPKPVLDESPERILEEALGYLAFHKPSRVVINSHGEAVNAMRAVAFYGMEIDVIYIRDDGWTLGAPKRYAAAARKTWENDWIAVVSKDKDLIKLNPEKWR